MLHRPTCSSIACHLPGRIAIAESPKRWKFLLAEAFLIVVSILLAFAIDAWWDARQEDGRRIELLQALRADLIATVAGLNRAIDDGESLVEGSGGFLDAVRGGEEISRDSLLILFESVGDVPFFEPTLASYRTAVATGAIELVRSPPLIARLSDFDFALGLYRLHLNVAAQQYFLGPIQDLRRNGVEFDSPGAQATGQYIVLPPGFDLRDKSVLAAAEPMYTVQRNMLENLQAMRTAAASAEEELDTLLGG